METGENDSPAAILAIDHNYTCLNSSLPKCLLGAASRATDHIPCFTQHELLGSPRAFQQLSAIQCLPLPVPRPTWKSDFPDTDYETDRECSKDISPILSDYVFHFDHRSIHILTI